MPFDSPASVVWSVPFGAVPPAGQRTGSFVIGFDDFPSPPAHSLAALIFNVVGTIIPFQSPRREEIPLASGGTTTYDSIGLFLIRGGQNVGGRRPLFYRRQLISTNQNMLAGTCFERNINGLVTVQVEVSPLLVWSCSLILYTQ